MKQTMIITKYHKISHKFYITKKRQNFFYIFIQNEKAKSVK